MDSAGQPVPGGAVAVVWSVVSGPVQAPSSFQIADQPQYSFATVRKAGTAGRAVVRATLPLFAQHIDFAITIDTMLVATTFVTLTTESSPGAFVSVRNRSTRPAVDTVPVGSSVQWQLSQFDYDGHYIKSAGGPSFVAGYFPYAKQSIVQVRFTTPGTYQYVDGEYPTATGTIVVR